MDERQRYCSQDVLETFVLISSHAPETCHGPFRKEGLVFGEYFLEKGYAEETPKSGFLRLTKKGRKFYEGLLEKVSEEFQGFPPRRR